MKNLTPVNMNKFLLGIFILSSVQAYACNIYMQMEKESNGYKIVQVSDSPINKPNTLMTTNYDGKWDSDLSPTRECSGYFANVPFANTHLAFMLTMGFVGSETPNGGKCEYNKSEIKLAADSSNYKTNPDVLKLIASCTQDNEAKMTNLRALRQREKEDQQREKEYEQQFRDSLKQGMQTNCGTFIEMKGIMAYVQTGGEAGAIWIKKDYLTPERDLSYNFIRCQDDNRTYRLNGSWLSIAK